MADPILILRPSRRKWLLVAVGSAIFVAFALWMPRAADDWRTMIPLVAIPFFSLGILVGILNQLPGASYLQLDSDGFTSCTMWRKRRYLWHDIAAIGATSIQAGLTRQKLVGFSFVAGSPPTAVGGRLHALNENFCGYQASLGDNYGLDHAELAELMHGYLVRSKG